MTKPKELSTEIWHIALWSWLVVINTVRYLRLPDDLGVSWERFILVAFTLISLFFLSRTVTNIVTGKYRRG